MEYLGRHLLSVGCLLLESAIVGTQEAALDRSHQMVAFQTTVEHLYFLCRQILNSVILCFKMESMEIQI